MFKTIFSKMIVIFISILIFSFSITGVMLYYFLDYYASSEKVKTLETSGDEINSFIIENVMYLENPLVLSSFRRILKLYGMTIGSYIWIVDTEGYIIITESIIPGEAIPGRIKKNLEVDGLSVRLKDKRQYERVMKGQEETVKEIGNFYGLFKDTGRLWLTIEKPFKYIDSNGNELVGGAVYLHTPLPEMQRTRTSVFKFFMISVGVAIFISIVLVYIFSLKFSNPLKEINNAARIISAGEFKKRLDIKSQDEIGELAESFNQMVSALESTEEMRRGFIANVSHELRTPMTLIRGFIEGILDGTIPSDKHKDYLTIVRDETNRLNRLINDLMDLAKMESGELKLSYKNFNVNELIRRCVIKLENLIIDKNIQIETNFEDEETYVYADPDAIERVIINLIHNAIKFTPENGTVDVMTFSQKDKILISVKDNGVGIEKGELDLIWERFYKSDKSRSKDKTGTGLGLAIVKNLINEHKQEIWVESEPGKGANFTFTLDKEPENGG